MKWGFSINYVLLITHLRLQWSYLAVERIPQRSSLVRPRTLAELEGV